MRATAPRPARPHRAQARARYGLRDLKPIELHPWRITAGLREPLSLGMGLFLAALGVCLWRILPW